MRNLLKKILKGESIHPPKICELSFAVNFDEAINVEWSRSGIGDGYEVIFYRNNLEHIATFGVTGELREYRMVLPSGSLPERIKVHLEEKGEIMNQVLINKGNGIQYEAIVRDKKLNRYRVELSDLGQVIRENLL